MNSRRCISDPKLTKRYRNGSYPDLDRVEVKLSARQYGRPMSQLGQQPTIVREKPGGKWGGAPHLKAGIARAQGFSSGNNARHGIGNSLPCPRTGERSPQQDNHGHHDPADPPSGMRSTAGTPIINGARDDQQFNDQTGG